MRADRLLSLVLLLQHRGRMSATALARELEVSTRTVLRDVEALSSAGVPVYAERGRTGGFALLAGFRTDLTGLTPDEALALLVAGSRTPLAGAEPALTSAMRKVVAALPEPRRSAATRDASRVLVRPEGWLPRSRHDPDPRDTASDARRAVVREAVFAGRRLRIRYASRDDEPRERVVDPVGLVEAGGRWYPLATRDGADRTYRLSRMLDAEVLDEPATRPSEVDLARAWQDRRARFNEGYPSFVVEVRVRAARLPDLTSAAREVTRERPDGAGWRRAEVGFLDHRHAEGVLWAFAPDAEALGPPSLRDALRHRAEATVARCRSAP